MNEYTKNPGEQDAAQAVSETPEPAQCGCGAEVCPGCGGQDAPACPGCGACAQPDEDIAPEAVALAADAPAEDTVETTTVVDVRFRNNAKSYFFDPGELALKPGAHVIMDTSRGVEYGVCAAGNHAVPSREIVPPLRKILRLATAQDERVNSDSLEKEKRAIGVGQQKIEGHQLEMQLDSAESA